MARPLTLSLPASIADEIEEASRRCERSVGFLVLGAMKGAGALKGPAPTGERRSLAVDTGEDDPKDLHARVKKLAAEHAPSLSLDDAVALGWQARRTQILAWVARVSAVNVAEQADELDEGLRAAADPATPAARLVALAKSAYPRVRVLVAGRKDAPPEALAILQKDREPLVRKTLEERD